MLNFADLRGSKMKKQMREQTQNAASNGKKAVDERQYYVKLAADDTNNAVVMRFLPTRFEKEGVPLHIAKSMTHNISVGNKWINFLCPKMIGQDCPMCRTLVWDENDSVAQQLYRDRKAGIRYYVNIYIIDDKQYPENNGAVRIMAFGKQLMTAIEDSIKEKGVNMFDLFEDGANFTVRAKPKSKNPKTGKMWPTFEASGFDSKSVFLGGDANKMEAIFNKTYDLVEFADAAKVLSFEEIEKKMATVNLCEVPAKAPQPPVADKKPTAEEVATILANSVVEDEVNASEAPPVKKATKAKATKAVEVAPVDDIITDGNDELDDMSDEDIDNLIDDMD
jgi:hypothetical protein